MSNKVRYFIGEPISYDSEREVLIQLTKTLNKENIDGIFFCNINIDGTQIDTILITEKNILVIEAKKYNTPIRGNTNGKWEYFSGGKWHKTNSLYSQSLGASFKFKNALENFLNVSVNYPDCFLIFTGGIPKGSDIDSDFKVKIANLSYLEDSSHFKKNNSISLEKFVQYAKSIHLEEVDSIKSATDISFYESEILIKQYCDAFISFNKPLIDDFVHLDCDVQNKAIKSSEIVDCESHLLIGESGCGKSHIQKHLGISSMINEKIPIIIEAKYFADSLMQQLDDEVQLLCNKGLIELLRAANKLQKQIFLFIDGYNECPEYKREKLSRYIWALCRRYQMVVSISDQRKDATLNKLALTEIKACLPTKEIKLEIAKKYKSELTDNEIALLETVKTNMEAKIIGALPAMPQGEDTRFNLFDSYVRFRLNTKASDGVKSLTSICEYLSNELTFSIPRRHADRIVSDIGISTSILDDLISAKILDSKGQSLTFSHELFMRIYAAESIIRKNTKNSAKLLEQLVEPKNAENGIFILSGIDSESYLTEVLNELTNENLVHQCLLGNCGHKAKIITEHRLKTLISKLHGEISNIHFELTGDSFYHVNLVGKEWSASEIAYLQNTYLLMEDPKIINVIFSAIHDMDLKINSEISRLRPEAKQKNFKTLRSSLFSETYVANRSRASAFSYIISEMRIFYRDLEKLSILIDEVKKLTTLSWGQLYCLIKFIRYKDIDPDFVFKIFSEFLPYENFRVLPYHLQIDLVDLGYGARHLTQEQTKEVVRLLNELYQKIDNILFTSQILDVISALGGLDEDEAAFKEQLQIEIREILANSSDPNFMLRANVFYFSSFDHPFSNAYSEIFSSLTAEEQKNLLVMTAKYEDTRTFFLSCLIFDLFEYNDPNTAECFTKWLKFPEDLTVNAHDSFEIFFIVHIVLAKLNYPLKSQLVTEESSFRNSYTLVAELLYLNNLEIKDEPRIAELLTKFKTMELFHALDAISWSESSLLKNVKHFPYTNLSFRDIYPSIALELSRKGLENTEVLDSLIPFKDNTSIYYSIATVEKYGENKDLSLLRKLASDQNFGSSAIKAISSMEKNRIIS